MKQQTEDLKEIVWDYYAKHARDLPWRHPNPDGEFDPYKIIVSEMMLQQTQVARVVEKYITFLQTFPDISSLAKASFSEVLAVWNGLGYNRRAKYLLDIAQAIITNYHSNVPNNPEELSKLTGIGKNTAAAICVYAYNQPHAFIETNIRSVFIYHFFNGQEAVDDKELIELVIKTLDRDNPREWYWALMDYGAHLKKTAGNHARLSKHYQKQSTFDGSKRQLRANLLRALLAAPKSLDELIQELNDDRIFAVLAELIKEELIIDKQNYYHLA